MLDRSSYRLGWACVALAAMSTTASGQVELLKVAPSDTKIVRVEQDWRVELYSASGGFECSPQLVSGFQLPNQDRLFQATLNHVDSPSFSAGGFQLQGWEGNTLVSVDSAPGVPLSGSNVVLTWTQIVWTTGEETGPATYSMALVGISAEDWRQEAWVSMQGSVPNLNSYDPRECLKNCAVVEGTNRVKWFGIVETRLYDVRGKLHLRDTAVKPVFQQPQIVSYYDFKKLDGVVNLTTVDSRVLSSDEQPTLLLLSR